MSKHARSAPFVPKSMRQHSTGISRTQALTAPLIHAGPHLESIDEPARHRSTSDQGASSASICFPPKALFDSIFKVLLIFPSWYVLVIGVSPVFSLGRNSPPVLGCIPKQPDSLTAPRRVAGSRDNGAVTLSGVPFQGTWARSSAEDASP